MMCDGGILHNPSLAIANSKETPYYTENCVIVKLHINDQKKKYLPHQL